MVFIWKKDDMFKFYVNGKEVVRIKVVIVFRLKDVFIILEIGCFNNLFLVKFRILMEIDNFMLWEKVFISDEIDVFFKKGDN